MKLSLNHARPLPLFFFGGGMASQGQISLKHQDHVDPSKISNSQLIHRHTSVGLSNERANDAPCELCFEGNASEFHRHLNDQKCIVHDLIAFTLYHSGITCPYPPMDIDQCRLSFGNQMVLSLKTVLFQDAQGRALVRHYQVTWRLYWLIWKELGLNLPKRI